MIINEVKQKLLEYNYNIKEIVLDPESTPLIENILSNETNIKVGRIKECFGIPIDSMASKLCNEEDCLIIFRLRRNVSKTETI